MGFSLERALAGAVAGAANAAGEVYDAQLKEGVLQRARAEEQANRIALAEEQDRLLAAREQRKQEYLDSKEQSKRSLYASLVEEQVSELKRKGIAIGGAEGQRIIGQAFIEKGYPEFANTFFDNAQKAQQADDNKELRKIQLANAAATSALARESKLAAREAKIGEAQKLAYKTWEGTLNDFEIKSRDQDGNTKTDSTFKNWMQASTASLAAKSPQAALDRTLQLGQLINELKDSNPTKSPFQITQMAEKRIRDQLAAAKGAEFNASQGVGSGGASRFQSLDNVQSEAPVPTAPKATREPGGLLGLLQAPNADLSDDSAGVKLF